jgi:hypothetical protein
MHKTSLLVVGALLSGTALAESDILLTISQTTSRSSQQVALDIFAASPFAGFEFEIEASDVSQVDTQRCVSRLPTSMIARCVRTPWGTVKALVYSMSLDDMPAGWYQVGVIDVGRLVDLRVKSVLFADGAAVERVGSAVSSNCPNPGTNEVTAC